MDSNEKHYVCLYCGDFMGLSESALKIFGKPMCCGNNMINIDFNKVYAIISALDALKKNLESEILKDVI